FRCAALLCGLGRVGIAVCPPAALPGFGRVGFVAPPVPAGPDGSGEHFEIGPFAQGFDALVGLIRFAAMLAPRRHDQFAYMRSAALRLAARREPASLRGWP